MSFAAAFLGGILSEDRAGPGPDAISAALRRARSGDAEAFATLWEAYADDVGRLCRRLLGDTPDAEDARSEAFLRAQRGFERYDAGQPFRRWLLALAAHHCVDRLRRRSVEGRIFDRSDLEEGAIPGPAPSPLRAVLRDEARRELRDALERLPDRDRVLIVLRHFAELSYAEIAASTEVPEARIGTLLYRARVRLRAELLASGAAS